MGNDAKAQHLLQGGSYEQGSKLSSECSSSSRKQVITGDQLQLYRLRLGTLRKLLFFLVSKGINCPCLRAAGIGPVLH